MASTPIADMVETLLSGGIPPEAIVAAVRAAERHAQAMVGEDPAASRRRAYDRERKRLKSAGNSTGNSGQKKGPPHPLKKILPTTSQDLFDEESRETGDARARGKSRSIRLPDDWMPSIDDLAKAHELLLATQVTPEIEKFRDYWHARAGPGAVKRDWSATWRNWCRKAAENGGSNAIYRNGSNGDKALGFAALGLRELRADAEARAREASG